MADLRNGDWIMTVSGVHFYPLDPRPNEIKLTDIAHALANLCRYTGHTHQFYSVAEHSIRVAQALPPALQMVGLMHDASEAYLSDISRPMKPFIARYQDIEQKLMLAIGHKFGFVWPMPPDVKAIDDHIIADEGAALMPEPEFWVMRYGPGLGREVDAQPPHVAKAAFLQAYRMVRARNDLRGISLQELAQGNIAKESAAA